MAAQLWRLWHNFGGQDGQPEAQGVPSHLQLPWAANGSAILAIQTNFESEKGQDQS